MEYGKESQLLSIACRIEKESHPPLASPKRNEDVEKRGSDGNSSIDLDKEIVGNSLA